MATHPRRRHKVKKPFKLICPKCRRHSELTLFRITCDRQECGMCGSHQSFTVYCEHCMYSYEEREV